MIGGSTAVIYFSILYALREWIGLSENLAVGISYFTSTAFHFLGNKFFVHQEPALGTMHIQFAKYIVLTLINYGITFAVTNTILFFGGNVYVGVLASIATTLVLTFVVMKALIFR